MTNKTGGQVAWPQGRRLQEGATLNIEEKFFLKKLFAPTCHAAAER
jgi:hypothetical protein